MITLRQPVIGFTHGVSAYRSNYCRCDVCRIASTDRAREERQARRERLLADPTLAPHGVPATYSNWGCRCRECTTAYIPVNARTSARAAARRKAAK